MTRTGAADRGSGTLTFSSVVLTNALSFGGSLAGPPDHKGHFPVGMYSDTRNDVTINIS